MEPCVQSYSSSEYEDNTKETTVTFQARTGDVPNVSDFAGLPNGINLCKIRYF
jgi:hypothetical protein